MSLLPPSLDSLVREVSKWPGVGERSALRYVIALLKSGKANMNALSRALDDVSKKVSFCSKCFFWANDGECTLCDKLQNKKVTHLCLVKSCSDVVALERLSKNDWAYHVLHGLLSPLTGIGPGELRLEDLFKRLQSLQVDELILAFDATVEGDATALYIREQLAELMPHLQISRMGMGLPAGSSIEYLDASTLENALLNRTLMEA